MSSTPDAFCCLDDLAHYAGVDLPNGKGNVVDQMTVALLACGDFPIGFGSFQEPVTLTDTKEGCSALERQTVSLSAPTIRLTTGASFFAISSTANVMSSRASLWFLGQQP